MTTQLSLPAPGRSLRARVKRRPFTHHNRLAAAVVLINVVSIPIADPSSMVLANFALAVLIRQQYVINLLFWLATRVPTHWPLRIRWTMGKVYHFGGLHVGASICATAWFPFTAPSLALTWVILALLLGMIVLALPVLRARQHNWFERAHRFGGWSVLALFALHAAATTSTASLWVLAVVTFSVLLPWLRLRRVPVRIDRPSRHVALVRFGYGVTPFAGSSTAVSRNPLLEWHSFANVPTPGQPGFRLTISRAGDWTGALIDDAPPYLWVKGIPTAGVGNIDKLFRKVVWVATGSGIGPCLPHLLAGETPSLLVWSTRHPRQTYGEALVNEILAVQPDAVIWDTDSGGKPDLLALTYQAYVESGAEAVICISNKSTTWQIVEELELRGIPAFGAIWDS
ncbi:hypothetical protein GCM10029976_007140 [Kribbella albertanoniae]|uniref:Uncharacterized protein n=1 Tax=Kribbella albertanoniae TaxID=1266829 RepID=A0A4R4Q459_9ACTN|nr:hypothetical protein [Kribbella albertanoniae]TDC29876.1 hypothetical protein E1261_14680 [Kribbella albertanoniae]